MKQTQKIKSLFAVIACGLIPVEGVSFTWKQPNRADENTIALYHFDEGAGTVAANEADASNPASVWEGTKGQWVTGALGTGIGSIDENLVATHDNAAVTTKSITIDWSKDLTVSFWARITNPYENEAHLIKVMTGTWQNDQFHIGFRAGTWNVVRLKLANVNAKDNIIPKNLWMNTIQDGEWHHIAMVYEFNSETQMGTVSFFVDNVPVELWGQKDTYQWVLEDSKAVRGPMASTIQFLHGCHGEVDEVLVQQSAIHDFSNGYNAPPFATVISVR